MIKGKLVKSILVTGGTGAMGSVLVKHLVEKKFKVRVLTLPKDPLVSRLDGMPVEIRYGDISSRNDITGICEGIEIVLHLAAIIISKDPRAYERINVEGTRNLIAEAKVSQVKHFVHISSASVVYPKSTPYSESKKTAEKHVIESGVPWTIIRPTLVYGETGGQEFDMFLNYLNRFPIVPFIGAGNAKKRPVYVDDITHGILKVIEFGRGLEKIYNFSGTKVISIIDFARFCLFLSGEHKRFLSIPVFLCVGLAKLLRLIMSNPPLTWSVIAGITQDADLDPSEAIKDIGYSPSALEEKLPLCFPRKKGL